MWLPFSKKKKELSEEDKRRCQRKCALALSSLRNCWHANSTNPRKCDSLEAQVVFCHAEVVCPEVARKHQQCFVRVLNSKGKEPMSACDVHIEAMKKCLREVGVYPFTA